MKKILYILLLVPIIYLASCSSGKSGLTPETMENTIVGKRWWYAPNQEGMLLTEEGDLYYLRLCLADSFLGTWIIDGDLIKYRFNSIEYPYQEVSSYTETELLIKATTDGTNLVLTTEFTELYGCTDATADNYNEDADCDDGSCTYCIDNCTYIPDDAFEQLLIDLGYDNVLDDYVLTENIINVKKLVLNVFNQDVSIVNLTGIEDFNSLEDIEISGYVSSILDLSSNILLKRIYVNGQMGTSIDSLVLDNNLDLEELILCGNLFMKTLDLSANSKLERLSIENTIINKIDLRNHSLVNLDLSFEYFDGSTSVCISVDDVSLANNQWPSYYFAEHCP